VSIELPFCSALGNLHGRIRPSAGKESFVQFADFSPPATPSLDQQRDALKKGLGRAMQWAILGVLDHDLLLEACLRDGRYDTQLEDMRGQWLWKMVQAVDAVDQVRVPILHALYALSNDRSADQLCELAWCFADSGDETFRKRLYENVEQRPVTECRSVAESAIIQLDGESAFLFAAQVRGKDLAERKWEWDDGSLVTQAIERWGEERVSDLLQLSTDSAIRLFRGGWLQEKIEDAEQPQTQSHRDRMQRIKVANILSAAKSNHNHWYLYRGWGMHADDDELETVLHHLWNSHDPTGIANLLKVFCKRPLPVFDARLIGLCQHIDSGVRRWAFNALQNNKHDLIRAYAVSELEKGVRDGFVVGLFARNYQRGDEQRIQSAIEFPDDEFEHHSLLMSVIDVLEDNPDAHSAELGIIGYASTPCGLCRNRFVRALLRQDAAPTWLTEECRFDAFSRIVESITGPTGTD
jgi:hypothetical protein